jgi:hypothetical protein
MIFCKFRQWNISLLTQVHNVNRDPKISIEEEGKIPAKKYSKNKQFSAR